MKRLLLYVHFDRDNAVDEHVFYQVERLVPFAVETQFISNSPISEAEAGRLRAFVSGITVRPNRGLDFGAWAEILNARLPEIAKNFDELWLMNDSCYGPVFPLEEIFDRMKEQPCDFWSITDSGGNQRGKRHLQSYFLIFRRKVLQSRPFQEFWKRTALKCTDCRTRKRYGEQSLDRCLRQAGFRPGCFISVRDESQNWRIGQLHPLSLFSAYRLVDDYQLPFLQVKAFEYSPLLPFNGGGLIFQALTEKGSEYPKSLILGHLRRTAPLSAVKNLTETLLLLPEKDNETCSSGEIRFGVMLHVYYRDLLPEMLEYLRRIRRPFKLFITTPHSGLEAELRAEIYGGLPAMLNELVVRKVSNRGRDIGAWLGAWTPEEHLSCDVVLKLHTKASPTDTEYMGSSWRRFLCDSLLASAGGISEILNEFAGEPKLGIVMPLYPPVVLLQCPEAFGGTPQDRVFGKALLKRFDLNPPSETGTPIFGVGSMFYYRPLALRCLFEAGIQPEEFPAEPLGNVGTLAHAVERMVPYIAQGMGFFYRQAVTSRQLTESYRILEDRRIYNYTTLARASKELVRGVWNSLVRRLSERF